jgi:hypothetical protein
MYLGAAVAIGSILYLARVVYTHRTYIWSTNVQESSNDPLSVDLYDTTKADVSGTADASGQETAESIILSREKYVNYDPQATQNTNTLHDPQFLAPRRSRIVHTPAD